MEPYSFCFFSHKVFDNSHDLLCQHILSYKPNPLNSITTFRKQPLLRVYGDYLDVSENFSKGHCASNSLCHFPNSKKLKATMVKGSCLGCGLAVHNECGYVNPEGAWTERWTCHICFDLFGRVVRDHDDPLYLSAKRKKPRTNTTEDIPMTEGNPAANTRTRRPTGFVALTFPTSFSASKEPTKRQRFIDRVINNKNPSNMYPKTSVPLCTSGDDVAKWWLDSRGEARTGIISADPFSAEDPVESHVYSREEMKAHITFSHRTDRQHLDRISHHEKTFQDIIRSAITLKCNLERDSEHAGHDEEDEEEEEEDDEEADEVDFKKPKKVPGAVHIPDLPFSNQDLVNICCLVDREREFKVDTAYDGKKNKFLIRVNSYEISNDKKLNFYLRHRKKALPQTPMMMTVYRSWLKKYLDWFDPDLYQYIVTHTDGVQVTRFADRLAADDDVVYQLSGCQRFDELMVPLPKMHKEVSTSD